MQRGELLLPWRLVKRYFRKIQGIQSKGKGEGKFGSFFLKTNFHLSSSQAKVPSKRRFSKEDCISLEFSILSPKEKTWIDNSSN